MESTNVGIPNNLYTPPAVCNIERPPPWMTGINPNAIVKRVDEEIADEFVEDGPPDQMNMYQATNAGAIAEKRLAQGLTVSKPIPALVKKSIKRSKISKKLSMKKTARHRAVGSTKKTNNKRKRRSTKKRVKKSNDEYLNDDDDKKKTIDDDDDNYLF